MNEIADNAWRLIALVVFILLNGFFTAAEYALVSVRRTRIQELEESGSRRARMVRDSVQHINRYVSATQVGVTIASLFVGWLGEPAVSAVLRPLLSDIGINDTTVLKTLSFAIAFLLITFVQVVVGEVAPKTIALQRSESVSLATIGVLRAITRMLSPLIFLLMRSAEALVRMVGVSPSGVGLHSIHSEEELKMLVSQSSKGGVLEDTEQEMLYNVFDFADKDVAEVMVPRPDVVAIRLDEPPAELLQRIIDEPFTRYPAFREDMDDIAGILHIRDLFSAQAAGGEVDLERLIRPAHVVPESKSLAGLLADFRRSKSHMALVVDEYGSLSGIVTMEDLLEEIVGEIDDEHDLPEIPVERISDNHFRVDGKFALDDLADQFGLEFPREDYHTIGGFVFGLLGQQPHAGDMVRYGNLRLEVTETDGPRIVHIDIVVQASKADSADNGNRAAMQSDSQPDAPAGISGAEH